MAWPAVPSKPTAGGATADATGWVDGVDAFLTATEAEVLSVAASEAAAAQAAAVQRANHTGTQAISTVTGLQTALDAKAATSHGHVIADTTGLQTALDGKQPLSAALTGTTASFTTAQETKLAGVEAGATADQTGAEIKTAYEGEADTNAYTDADAAKVAGIEAAADVTDEANVTDALDGATLTDVGTPASGDLVLLQDASDANVLKVAQFSTFGGGGGGTSLSPKQVGPKTSSWLQVPGTLGVFARSAQDLFVHPYPIDYSGTLDALGIEVTTGVASCTGNLVLYSSTDGLPDAKVADVSVNLASTGRVVGTISGGLAVTPGLYWIGALFLSGGSGISTTRVYSGSTPFPYAWVGSDEAFSFSGSTSHRSGFKLTGQTSPPASWGTAYNEDRYAPQVLARWQ